MDFGRRVKRGFSRDQIVIPDALNPLAVLLGDGWRCSAWFGVLLEASHDRLWILTSVHDAGDDDPARLDSVEDAKRKSGNEQSPIIAVNDRPTLGEDAKLSECLVQAMHKNGAQTLSAVLVVVISTLDIEVGGEKRNDLGHAALEPLPKIRDLIASQVVTWVGSLR